MSTQTKSESQFNMLDWAKKVVVENYANFEGRARRSEFWYYNLLYFIVSLGITILVYVFGEGSTLGTAFNLLSTVLSLGLLVPSLAVGARRLHDINKSGWWQLLSLTIIGIILLLVWWFQEGDRHSNEYGEDPKNPEGPVFDFENKQGA